MPKVNPFKERFFPRAARNELIVKGLLQQFFGDDSTDATLENVLLTHKDALFILQSLPPSDVAFEYFFNQEKTFRKLALAMYQHSGGGERLGLLIDDIPVGPMRKDIMDACEIYSIPFIDHVRHGGNFRTDIMLDFTGKDLDSPEFMEAIEMIISVVTPDKMHDRRPLLSLQLVDCYKHSQ